MNRPRSSAFLHDAETRLRELMLLGLGGNAAAHGQMLAELASLLRRFYRRRLGHDQAEVEDLVQETLLAVHTRRSTYDPEQSFTAWAYAVARYKLIDHWRRRRLRQTLNIDDYRDLFGVDATEAADARRDVGELLAELPARHRVAIELTRIEGFSTEEAAARTGQSVSAIKIGVHRGLKRLSALLGGGRTD